MEIIQYVKNLKIDSNTFKNDSQDVIINRHNSIISLYKHLLFVYYYIYIILFRICQMLG